MDLSGEKCFLLRWEDTVVARRIVEMTDTNRTSLPRYHRISVVKSALFASGGYGSSTTDYGDNRYKYKSYRLRTSSKAKQSKNSHSHSTSLAHSSYLLSPSLTSLSTPLKSSSFRVTTCKKVSSNTSAPASSASLTSSRHERMMCDRHFPILAELYRLLI
jgi:hypothetical protein